MLGSILHGLWALIVSRDLCLLQAYVRSSTINSSGAMPCSHCGRWVDDWIIWRRYDAPECLNAEHQLNLCCYKGVLYYFFCSGYILAGAPGVADPTYINADGNASTDSELEPMIDEVFRDSCP